MPPLRGSPDHLVVDEIDHAVRLWLGSNPARDRRWQCVLQIKLPVEITRRPIAGDRADRPYPSGVVVCRRVDLRRIQHRPAFAYEKVRLLKGTPNSTQNCSLSFFSIRGIGAPSKYDLVRGSTSRLSLPIQPGGDWFLRIVGRSNMRNPPSFQGFESSLPSPLSGTASPRALSTSIFMDRNCGLETWPVSAYPIP